MSDAEEVMDLAEPLDLAGSLRLHRLGKLDATCLLEPARVIRTARADAGPVTLELSQESPTRVLARAWGPGAVATLARLPRWLGEDSAFPAVEVDGLPPGAADLYRRLRRRHRALRLLPALRPYDLTVAMVLQQRVRFIDATRAWRGLLDRLGAAAPGPQGLALPPAARDVIGLGASTLGHLGIDRQRADLIRRVARHEPKLREVEGTPLVVGAQHPFLERLATIPGIGPWTLGMVGGFGLGDPDAVIPGDFHLPHLVSWALAGTPRGNDATMLEHLEPFRPERFRLIRWLWAEGIKAPRYGPKLGDTVPIQERRRRF